MACLVFSVSSDGDATIDDHDRWSDLLVDNRNDLENVFVQT